MTAETVVRWTGGILPGLRPPMGAVLAETVGWRWAFVAPLPLIVFAAAMVMPSLRGVSVSEEGSRLPVVASLVLMVGAGGLLAGLTDLSAWSIPLVVVGLAVTIPALRRITPPGTLTARRGSGEPERVLERLRELVEVGFGGMNFIVTGPDAEEQRERLAGEVLPALRATSRA